jgi:hypothetical protein
LFAFPVLYELQNAVDANYLDSSPNSTVAWIFGWLIGKLMVRRSSSSLANPNIGAQWQHDRGGWGVSHAQNVQGSMFQGVQSMTHVTLCLRLAACFFRESPLCSHGVVFIQIIGSYGYMRGKGRACLRLPDCCKICQGLLQTLIYRVYPKNPPDDDVWDGQDNSAYRATQQYQWICAVPYCHTHAMENNSNNTTD